MRVSRVPLADLASTQGSGLLAAKSANYREHHTPKSKGAGEENDQTIQYFDSDEESFGEGDIFTSTDQQQLPALRSQQDNDETTTEF